MTTTLAVPKGRLTFSGWIPLLRLLDEEGQEIGCIVDNGEPGPASAGELNYVF